MSMGIVLTAVRNQLRAAAALADDQCLVLPGAEPLAGAGELLVAIDERGVTSEARGHLQESYEIEVALWRRAGQYPGDRAGDLLLAGDPYLAALATLDQLERRVIAALHGNYLSVVAEANAAAGETGMTFHLALFYVGRERSEAFPPRRATGRDGTVSPAVVWYGRRLRFRGMDRAQRTG